MYLPQIVILLFSLLSFISFKLEKNWTNPSFLTSTLWLIIITAYNYLPHELYNLSNKFYYSLLLWVFPFCIFSSLFSKFNLKVPKILKQELPNSNWIKPTLNAMLISSTLLIFLLYRLSQGSDSIAGTIRMLSINHELPTSISLLMYIFTFGIVFITYYFLEKGINYSIKFKVLCILYLIIILFLGNKGTIAQLMFAIIYILQFKNKLNKKTFIAIISGCVFLMSAVVIFRNDAEDATLIDYLLIYILSPLPAFDMVINSEFVVSNGFPGSMTFAALFRIFDAVGVNIGIKQFQVDSWWVNVPLPTNVFTVMQTFYIDFGYLGIFIFSSLFGIIWGQLFNFTKRKIRVFVLIYALFFYWLFLTFFADYIFTFFSISIQMIFFSILFYLRITLRNKHYKYS